MTQQRRSLMNYIAGRSMRLLEDDDVLISSEEEYGADCSAEFILLCDSFLVWFKEV